MLERSIFFLLLFMYCCHSNSNCISAVRLWVLLRSCRAGVSDLNGEWTRADGSAASENTKQKQRQQKKNKEEKNAQWQHQRQRATAHNTAATAARATATPNERNINEWCFVVFVYTTNTTTHVNCMVMCHPKLSNNRPEPLVYNTNAYHTYRISISLSIGLRRQFGRPNTPNRRRYSTKKCAIVCRSGRHSQFVTVMLILLKHEWIGSQNSAEQHHQLLRHWVVRFFFFSLILLLLLLVLVLVRLCSHCSVVRLVSRRQQRWQQQHWSTQSRETHTAHDWGKETEIRHSFVSRSPFIITFVFCQFEVSEFKCLCGHRYCCLECCCSEQNRI